MNWEAPKYFIRYKDSSGEIGFREFVMLSNAKEWASNKKDCLITITDRDGELIMEYKADIKEVS